MDDGQVTAKNVADRFETAFIDAVKKLEYLAVYCRASEGWGKKGVVPKKFHTHTDTHTHTAS